jgi:polysaccharide deacetylase 2 family uncharacterized protein YibQ
VGLLLFLRYRPARPRPEREAERARLAASLRRAIERAGGDEVWVKAPPYSPFPPPRAEAPAEALVAQPRFDAVIAALEAEGQAGGIRVVRKMAGAGRGRRRAEIRLLRGRELAGRWTLHEVPRIRHAALIIDDLRQDMVAARQLLALPYPITFAVLPHLPQSKATAEEVHRAGRQVMLHLPMQPDSPAKPGPGEIRVGMRGFEIERQIEEDLDSVPYAAGVNNHMGSRATQDARLMAAVMEALERRQLFFIDSRTTPASVALDVARRRGLPAFYRSVFLDDTESVPYTLAQLREFIRVLEDQDAAIAIGHPYPTTLNALAQFLPELERRAIRMVPASELLRRPEVARLAPPTANSQ